VQDEQGVVTLAYTGESKAEAANLHARLLSTFLINRPALLAKFAKEEGASKSSSS
jgi:phosphoheptose isomerase